MLACLVGAAALGALLVARSRVHPEPVLALDLLRAPTFSLASLATFLFVTTLVETKLISL